MNGWSAAHREMSEKAMNKVLCAAAAGVVATVVFSASGQAQGVNYNSSKSNTGNVTARTPAACPGGVSRNAAGACPPGGGATSPTTSNASTYPSLDAHSHDPLK